MGESSFDYWTNDQTSGTLTVLVIIVVLFFLLRPLFRS